MDFKKDNGKIYLEYCGIHMKDMPMMTPISHDEAARLYGQLGGLLNVGCRECGYWVCQGAKFCHRCGKDIKR